MVARLKGTRWLRPAVDGAMAVVLLLQMVPGKTGNVLHEVLGVAFVVLFATHHVLNRGWLRRWGRQRTFRSRCTLGSDILLTICVVGMAVSGLMMSRSVAPMLGVPSAAHVVHPLHGALAYLGLMTCAFHVGLHVRVVRGYVGKKGKARVPVPLMLVSVAVGLWSFARLGVAGKLLGQPSFPDGMTPLWVQLMLHAVLCLPFLVVGSMVDTMAQGGTRDRR